MRYCCLLNVCFLDFVTAENDAEISVRSNLVLVCFVLSLVVALEWISIVALWKYATVDDNEIDR